MVLRKLDAKRLARDTLETEGFLCKVCKPLRESFLLMQLMHCLATERLGLLKCVCLIDDDVTNRDTSGCSCYNTKAA